MLGKSARTVSRELNWKNVSTLGLLHMVNRGCCDNTLLLCKLVFMLFTIGQWHSHRGLKHYILHSLQNDNFKTA